MTQKESIPVKAGVIAHTELPPYLRIADKATDLREMGMSDRVIASLLGISDKTVAHAAGVDQVLAPDRCLPKRQSADQASPSPPSKDVPSGCGLGCPHPDGT